MNKDRIWLPLGLALLLLGAIGLFFSQWIIEDWLEIERPFGEEPLSLRFVRAGGIVFLAGLLSLAYGGWRAWKRGSPK
jgi:hypothetical protein